MRRSVERWANSDQKAMAKQSEAAIMYAFEDAKADILQMAELLKIVGYPRRGTDEEFLNEFELAELVQSNFTLDDLAG